MLQYKCRQTEIEFRLSERVLRWQGLICARNTPNYQPPHPLFAHWSPICFYIQSHAVHSTMISLAFHQFCQFTSMPAKERVRWPSALSSQYEFASIGCAYAHMLYYILSTHAHTHTLSYILPANASFGIRWLGMGTVLFWWRGKGERGVWSGDPFVEWHNKSTEIQIVAQSHTPTTEFYRHYEIPDNDTKAAATTTEKRAA